MDKKKLGFLGKSNMSSLRTRIRKTIDHQVMDFIARLCKNHADKMTDPKQLMTLWKETRSPPKPKRLSGYNLFVRENTKLLRQDNPQIPFVDLSRQNGLTWRTVISSDKKEQYKRRAQIIQKYSEHPLFQRVMSRTYKFAYSWGESWFDEHPGLVNLYEGISQEEIAEYLIRYLVLPPIPPQNHSVIPTPTEEDRYDKDDDSVLGTQNELRDDDDDPNFDVNDYVKPRDHPAWENNEHLSCTEISWKLYRADPELVGIYLHQLTKEELLEHLVRQYQQHLLTDYSKEKYPVKTHAFYHELGTWKEKDVRDLARINFPESRKNWDQLPIDDIRECLIRRFEHLKTIEPPITTRK